MAKWTDKRFAEELKLVSDGLGRMPTNSELKKLGRGDLSNQIVKRGGFKPIADRFGLRQSDSDSLFGWEGEKMAQEVLEEKGFQVERSGEVRWPFDLLVDGLVRVDVKSARFAQYGPCSGWFYRIGKRPQADVIMLVQVDTKEAYYLHWLDCPSSNITISRDGGKYRNFKGAHHLIHHVRSAVGLMRSGIPKIYQPGDENKNLICTIKP